MKEKKAPLYITTPIYYVTDAPHIGHLYTTLAADIRARYERLSGNEVWFLTGTDEHGQKIEKKAKEQNLTPQALADKVVERYRTAWKRFEITYDDFIRTTEERHKKLVVHFMEQLLKTGDIYLDQYEGWYCVPDESYWTETQVVDGKCPDCGRPVEKLKEESYFFKMSAYQDRLLEHIKKNPKFIMPESRRNEVLGFIQQGLKDISISRTTIQWGIPMPADAKATKQHKVYVWFDALTNYLSALAPLEKNSRVEELWPHAVHLVGKDILRFHAVYWPTFLMALGRELPKQIVAHGWLTDANRKMSKSLGNVVDPIALADEVGTEGVRYFMFREFVFGLDGEYTKEVVYRRINSDLANDFGNCVNRLCNMVPKYLGADPIEVQASLKESSEVRTQVEQSVPAYHAAIQDFAYHKSLEAIWQIVSTVNKFIESNAPWTLAKSTAPEDQARLKLVLLHCLEGLRVVSVLAAPYLPRAAAQALIYLGDPTALDQPNALDRGQWGKGPDAVKVTKGDPLFPRLEWKPPTT
jgi:methionyl-tRNA synthetase